MERKKKGHFFLVLFLPGARYPGYTISPHAYDPGGQLEAVPGGGSVHSSSPSPRGSDLQPPQQTSADGQVYTATYCIHLGKTWIPQLY